MASLSKIEGIGAKNAKKLADAGIKTTDALLAKGASPAGRRQISKDCGISEKLVLRWVNNADLFRLKGVGEEYADLLESSGVDTVRELSQRKPVNLLEKMVTVNKRKKLVRQLPTERMVEEWVSQAKKLPRVVRY